MKKLLTGTAVLAALMLTGLSARASCSDPRAGAQQLTPSITHQGPMSSHFDRNAGENIVGTWHVVYTAFGAPFAAAFIQWNSDGNEWENISQPTLGGNICMGSWKAVDKTHVFRNHFGWLFTNGIVSGYFNETETDEVARDGNSYSGLNETTIFDMSGNILQKIPGTSAATKIGP
ncbi:MAG TPA: hypothetical protein VGI32_14605 [Steroidobacteraceae bacterium]